MKQFFAEKDFEALSHEKLLLTVFYKTFKIYTRFFFQKRIFFSAKAKTMLQH